MSIELHSPFTLEKFEMKLRACAKKRPRLEIGSKAESPNRINSDSTRRLFPSEKKILFTRDVQGKMNH